MRGWELGQFWEVRSLDLVDLLDESSIELRSISLSGHAFASQSGRSTMCPPSPSVPMACRFGSQPSTFSTSRPVNQWCGRS
mgnify:CR=1 FL=1